MLHLGVMGMLEPMIPRYPKLILGSMLHATPELPGLRERYLQHFPDDPLPRGRPSQ